jgi:hypothetical protein
MWQSLVFSRFPEMRHTPRGEEALSELDNVGSDLDAERALGRAEEIRVKMLGTGTDG